MPKKPFSAPVKRPAAKKAARKTVVKKTARKTAEKTARKTARKTAVKKAPVKKTGAGKITAKAAKKPVAAKPEREKRPRAKVTHEHPGNLVADPHDHTANEAIAARSARRTTRPTPRKQTATDIAADPPPGDTPATSMVARVSDAIERELSKIERIVGNPSRLYPAQRIETESRARVLASLARTLKEVMRLREQERGVGDHNAKADDDAIPRDLDEFRRELSRRLEGLVESAAPVSDRGDEPG
ncbi:MAG: hypothetical protein G4V63_04645 [Candidatus Afipia apatlaquensis]|uniref:Uncharacterized protein n=1 Tax=Candidatus Afipia apatlaquensis TaxID=2712852 RepID=A0A7C9VIG9_9BRAD|nr:hypothetical protein [Candidatus Afipia apatlaquensis]